MVTNPGRASRGTHNHDDLATELVAATAGLVAEKGPSGFSLREVARRAGVSPAAPSHHFGNARGLLTAVATQGYAYLDQTIATAESEAVGSLPDDAAGDPARRLRALAFAYIDVGLRHPGHVGIMFRPDLVDQSNPAFQLESAKPYERLRVAIDGLADDLDPDLVDAATRTTWAMLSGFVTLYLNSTEGLDDDLERLVSTAVSILHRGTVGLDLD